MSDAGPALAVAYLPHPASRTAGNRTRALANRVLEAYAPGPQDYLISKAHPVRVATRFDDPTARSAKQLASRHTHQPSSRGVLRIVDVALRYGVGYDGLATYLHAKRGYVERTRAFEHHAIVPAPVADQDGGWRELRQSTRSRHDQRRFARRGDRRLLDLLAEIAPDVVLLHGPFAHAGRIVAHAHALGATTIGVPWRAESAAARTRSPLRSRALLALGRPAVVDAVLSTTAGVHSLYLGIDAVFRPQAGVRRDGSVLFIGELSRSSGVFDLLMATAYSSEPREVQIYGRGTHERALTRHVASYGLSHRVHVHPYLADRAALAKEIGHAGCVVVPGPPTRGRLVALEAAATGVPVVASEGSAIIELAPELAYPFPQSDIPALSAAIRAARVASSNPNVGARLGSTLAWDNAFQRELEDLRELADHE